MKILIVSQYFYPEDFRINDIAAELIARGHQVQVLTGLPDYATSVVPKEYKWHRKRDEIMNQVSIHRVPIIARRHGPVFRFLNYVSFVVTSWLYSKFGKKPDADIVFVYQTSPVFQAVPALSYGKRLKIPVVLYCCDLWPESLKAGGITESNPVFSIIKKISSKLYCACDCVCVTSKAFVRYLADVCRVPTEKMTYLPQHAEDLYSEIAGQYEQNQCVDFLFAGNIGVVQNVDCILNAVAHMDKSLPFCVHIVGDGSELDNCKKMAHALQVEDKVVFHGRYPLQAMRKFYKLADCFLLTLRDDDFTGKTVPAKLQGYLSAGKPVIAAAGEGVQEMVAESDSGISVPAGDFTALAEAMKAVVLDHDQYKEKGAAGRRYYEANCSKKVYMDRLTGIFQDFIKGV
nr:glycosyltransferase family 4 protein [bacterium]